MEITGYRFGCPESEGLAVRGDGVESGIREKESMNEIKCPHCGEMFTIDEAGFAAILEAGARRRVRQGGASPRAADGLRQLRCRAVGQAEALAKAQGDAVQKEAHRRAGWRAAGGVSVSAGREPAAPTTPSASGVLVDAAAAKDARIVELEQRVEAQGRGLEAEKKLAVWSRRCSEAEQARARTRWPRRWRLAIAVRRSRCEHAPEEQRRASSSKS